MFDRAPTNGLLVHHRVQTTKLKYTPFCENCRFCLGVRIFKTRPRLHEIRHESFKPQNSRFYDVFFTYTNWPSIQGHTQPVNLITDTALFETALQIFFFGSDGLAKLLVDEWTQIFSNSIKFVISAFLDSLGRWLKAAFKLCARARCPLGTNANTPRYPLGTSVNTTYIQVPTLEFGHSDGDRLQGQVQCRGPRLLGHKSEHRVRPCVHDIFSSSGGGRIHRFMHDVKFMFQNGVWQGEME